MSIGIYTEVDMTPTLLAELFWGLSDHEQAEFFGALYDAIQRDNRNGKTWFRSDEFGTMQWSALRRAVDGIDQPRQLQVANMIRALAAPLFLYAAGYDWERFPHEIQSRPANIPEQIGW